jgi:hypothetical protein
MAIGHTADDIECAYELLYRKLDKETVRELIAWSEEQLRKEKTDTSRGTEAKFAAS